MSPQTDNIRVSGIKEIGRTIGKRKIFQVHFLDARYRRLFTWAIYIYIFKTSSRRDEQLLNKDVSWHMTIILIITLFWIDMKYTIYIVPMIKCFKNLVQKRTPVHLNNQIKRWKSCLFFI